MGIRQELERAARRHQAAERNLARARERLRRTMRKAQDSNEISMTEVAAICGMSRQNVYKMLRETPEKQ